MRPFLKWAGSKYSIVSAIQGILNAYPGKTRLIEPFLGSGAVFLNTDYDTYLLSDSNPDLITLYQTLQEQGEPFIDYCQTFFTPQNNDPDQYYTLRETFNTSADPMLKSALFLYLNRHGFNGLCRYNARHQFNVPFGRYTKPYFPQKEMLAFYRQSQQAVFINQDFADVMAQATPNDIVYCDPPYVPLSKTASFTQYSSGQFGLAQQAQLVEMAVQLSQRGVIVLISNHNTPFVQQAYQGARLQELTVQRSISCQGDKREKVSEILALFSA